MKIFIVLFLFWSLLIYGCGNKINDVDDLQISDVKSNPWTIEELRIIPNSKDIVLVILKNSEGSSIGAITGADHSLEVGRNVFVDMIRYNALNTMPVSVYLIRD